VFGLAQSLQNTSVIVRRNRGHNHWDGRSSHHGRGYRRSGCGSSFFLGFGSPGFLGRSASSLGL
jgi:hypothetical protein